MDDQVLKDIFKGLTILGMFTDFVITPQKVVKDLL